MDRSICHLPMPILAQVSWSRKFSVALLSTSASFLACSCNVLRPCSLLIALSLSYRVPRLLLYYCTLLISHSVLYVYYRPVYTGLCGPCHPPILVRTVCASSQATPAYSGYYSHTHTWPFRTSYSAVLWARVSQLASDLTHLFVSCIALIMHSYTCIIKHTRSLPSSLHQHLRLLMPADEVHLCLLIAYWFLSNSPSLPCI